MQYNITLKHPVHGEFDSDLVEMSAPEIRRLSDALLKTMDGQGEGLRLKQKGQDFFFGQSVLSESVVTLNKYKL